MTAADYLVGYLADMGVTDVFGIPGGVVLDLLYAFEREPRITPHLSYHEQGAALEACGYAQYDHRLGAAYATRGPGFTNLVTGIAEAYADSIPVIFITAHSGKCAENSCRFEKEQELDTVHMVKHITKYAETVDGIGDVCRAVQTACSEALSGRKGPVFLDFSNDIWELEIGSEDIVKNEPACSQAPVREILNALSLASRPAMLVGDGIRQAGAAGAFELLSHGMGMPVLSSRCGQDVGAVSQHYYGYIGSHGIRYSNFIFAKADFVLAVGNRLGFPLGSESFRKALKGKRIIRVDVDSRELARPVCNTESYRCDINVLIGGIKDTYAIHRHYGAWLSVCETLRGELCNEDQNALTRRLAGLFMTLSSDVSICADVGNSEFWVSRAYVESGIRNRILYSKSFGTLGCGIPKAIGAAVASGKPVLCIVGDQGFQMNVQELQLIAEEKLPVCIIVINNRSSGMIRDRQKVKYRSHFVHTTLGSGYGVPDIRAIAKAYGIAFFDAVDAFPSIVEVDMDEDVGLEPSLPAGNDIQDMYPYIDKEKYGRLARL